MDEVSGHSLFFKGGCLLLRSEHLVDKVAENGISLTSVLAIEDVDGAVEIGDTDVAGACGVDFFVYHRDGLRGVETASLGKHDAVPTAQLGCGVVRNDVLPAFAWGRKSEILA